MKFYLVADTRYNLRRVYRLITLVTGKSKSNAAQAEKGELNTVKLKKTDRKRRNAKSGRNAVENYASHKKASEWKGIQTAQEHLDKISDAMSECNTLWEAEQREQTKL